MISRSDEPRGTSEPRRISSLQNDTVKLLRSLHMRKARRETGLFLVEGGDMLARAREYGWTPRTLLMGANANGEPLLGDVVQWARRAEADTGEHSRARSRRPWINWAPPRRHAFRSLPGSLA